MHEPTDDRDLKLAKLQEVLAELEERGTSGSSLFDVQHEQEKAKVRNRALNLLDHRARSRHELRERLLGLEFEPALVEEVLEDLANSKLLNDTLFAQEWVRQRHQRRGKSRRALDQELKQKGVGTRDRAEALDQIDDDDEEAVATSLAEKKVRSIRTAPEDRSEYDKILRRVVGMLARRGYNEGLAFRVSKSALDQRIEDISY